MAKGYFSIVKRHKNVITWKIFTFLNSQETMGKEKGDLSIVRCSAHCLRCLTLKENVLLLYQKSSTIKLEEHFFQFKIPKRKTEEVV